MKNKLLFLLAAFSLIFAACEKTDEGKNTQISVSDQTELKQDAYADESNTGTGFTFTAKSDWQATVTETTKTAPGWLKLMLDGKETYEGKAGTFSFVIELGTNHTGKTRSATITIVCGEDKITITVTQDGLTEDGKKPEDTNPVTAIELNENSIELEVGEKFNLIATVLPENATDKSVYWVSSDTAVATVDKTTGEVTAIAEGKATVTAASTAYDTITASCEVTVTDEDTPPTPTEKGSFKFKGDTYSLYEIAEASIGDYYRDGYNCRYIYLEGPSVDDTPEYEVFFEMFSDMESTTSNDSYSFSSSHSHNTFSSESYVLIDGSKRYISGGKVDVINDLAHDKFTVNFTVNVGIETAEGNITVDKLSYIDFDFKNVSTRSAILDKYLEDNFITPGYEGQGLSWVELPKVTYADFPWSGSGNKISGRIMLEQFPNINFINLSGHAIELIELPIGEKSGPVTHLDLSDNDLRELNIGYQNDLDRLICTGNPNLNVIDISRQQMTRYEKEGDKFITKDAHTTLYVGVEN